MSLIKKMKFKIAQRLATLPQIFWAFKNS